MYYALCQSLRLNTFTILQMYATANKLEKKAMNGTPHSQHTHKLPLWKKASKCQWSIIVSFYYYVDSILNACMAKHLKNTGKYK